MEGFLDRGRISLIFHFDLGLLAFTLDLNTWCVGFVLVRQSSLLTIYLLCFYITIVWNIEED